MIAYPQAAGAAEPVRPDGALYRLVWRCHFFAGLICLPVLTLMAITGALYLFQEEINDTLFASRRFVPAAHAAAAPLPLSEIVSRAMQQQPGQLHELTLPDDTRRSVMLVVTPTGGERSVLHADPSNGRVLNVSEEAWQWDKIARKLHSLELIGRWANIGVEIVAGWCLVLVASGVFLWWPRGRSGGVVSVRGSPRRRLWWRDVHAVSGALTAAVIVFLALTGMPWSALWGQQMNAMTQAAGLGVPAAVWDEVPQSQVRMAAQGPVPWTWEATNVPRSTTPADASPPAIGVDAAAAVLAQRGVQRGYSLRLPEGPQGVYTALVMPPEAQRQRVLHFDQYSGRVIVDVGYADYGAVARVTEWGIAVHKGGQYGAANQWLMFVGCLGVIALAVSSVVMWWKRRPAGALAAPPRKADDRWAVVALLVAAAIGLFFPPLGASMLVAAAIGAAASRLQRLRRIAT